MKTLAILALMSLPAWALQQDREETLQRTLRFAENAANRTLLVDNIRGSIVVTSGEADAVEMKAIRRTFARTPEDRRKAEDDVRLEIRERGGRIEVVVDAPWRDRWAHRWDDECEEDGYEVEVDFEFRVPRKVNLHLRIVREGEIEVKGIHGDFEVKNVNGDVTMEDIAGAGHFSTVNGSLRVTFLENPASESLFRTVNGKVEVSFQDPLSADLVLKTFNGDAYTEFDVTSVPLAEHTVREGNGRRVYRSAEAYMVRAGQGGPRLAFNTLNGSIHILKHQDQ